MFGMKEQTPTWKSILVSAFLGFSLLLATGCSEKEDDKTSLTEDQAAAAAGDTADAEALADQAKLDADDAAKIYTGTQSFSGSVDTSSLSSSDKSLLASRSFSFNRSSSDATLAGTELVKLYVVNGDGELKFTGITCDVATDGSGDYTCDGVLGGIDYIVRYVKQLDDNKTLEMRSTASVPETGTVPDVVINPVTTLVAEAVVQAVSEAITGLVANEELVQEIIESVKAAVEQTLTTLIQSGVITIPSMVEEGDLADVSQTATEKEALATATGTVLSDDNVSEALTSTKTDALVTSLTYLSNRQKIALIFDQMLEDGGAPKWMVNFIGDNWNNVTDDMTFGWMATNIVDALETDPDDAKWELEKLGLTSDTEIANFLDDLKTYVTGKITDGTALTEAKTAISQYHTIKAKAAADRTEDEVQFLKEFPPVVGELFPATFISTVTASTKFQNSGQVTAYLIFLADIFTREQAAEYMQNQTTYTLNLFGDEAQHMHLVNFEDPSFIFIELGFDATAAAAYAGVYFNDWAEIRSDKIWDDTDGSSSAILRVETGVENPMWFFNPITTASVTSAKLTYPTATGTKQVDLDYEVKDGESVWLHLDSYICTDNTYSDCSPNPDGVTDHVSGNYTISVTVAGVTASKTFENVIVINDPDTYRPKLVSPREFPQWSEDMNDTEWMALEQAFWDAGGVSVFAPNVGDTLEGAVFKWTAPDVSALNLPDNIKVAYQISISRYQTDSNATREYCEQGNWDECNTEIYSSWWEDRVITGTSFTLPISLPQNQTEDWDNGIQDQYSVGVNMVLVNKDTGRYITEGGSSWTNFRVGQPPYIVDGSEPVNFTGTISLEGSTFPSNAVVALMAESNVYSGGTWTWTTEVITSQTVSAAGTYELNTTTGEIKTALAAGKWISLMVFNDNGTTNGSWDPWNGTTGEDAWWLTDKWFWFETWGDFRITTDDTSGNIVTTPVKDASGATLNNMDITVYSY